ncbi:hypothetical protein ACFVT5_41320 [Streptomyces sp. NPDC058001]|uniref:hypothetical protein n=1 Tax=Streptomyces sp. NPDC058001 TaxID=3346300 RepID=UPI0036E4825F
MNWAELRDLVDALPEDSATKAAASGDVEGRRWTQDTFIGAAQYNALIMLVRILWTAHLKGKPPDLDVIQPPHMAADDAQAELEAAGREYSEAILNQYSPGTSGTSETDQAEIDHWAAKIRELEAH